MEIDDYIRQKWTRQFQPGDLTKIENFAIANYPLYQNRRIKIPKAIKHGFADEETIKIINEYYNIQL